MAVDCGKQPAVGSDYVFVLCGLADRSHDLTIDGNQVILMPVGLVAAPET